MPLDPVHYLQSLQTRFLLCTILILIAVCLTRWLCKRPPVFTLNASPDKRTQMHAQTPLSTQIRRTSSFSFSNLFSQMRHRPQSQVILDTSLPTSPRSTRFSRRVRTNTKKDSPSPTNPASNQPLRTKQPYEAFLVLDVEATCQLGADFNFPNEIIVCVLLIKGQVPERSSNP